jgi:hypothetical protein
MRLSSGGRAAIAAIAAIAAMKIVWEAVPTTEDDGTCRMDTPLDRLRTVCRLLGMVLLGILIGCTFVLIRELTGFQT